MLIRVGSERRKNMLKKQEGKKDYQGISLPFDLINRIDLLISDGTLGYNSRTEFIKEAVRIRLDDLEEKNKVLQKLKKELMAE